MIRDDTMEHQTSWDMEQFSAGGFLSDFIKDLPQSAFLLHFHDPHYDPTGATDHQEQQQQQAPSQPAAVAFTGNGLLYGPQTEVRAPTIPNLMAGHQEQMTTTTPPAAPTPNDLAVAAMPRSTSDDSGYGGSPLELYAASTWWGGAGDLFFPPPPPLQLPYYDYNYHFHHHHQQQHLALAAPPPPQQQQQQQQPPAKRRRPTNPAAPAPPRRKKPRTTTTISAGPGAKRGPGRPRKDQNATPGTLCFMPAQTPAGAPYIATEGRAGFKGREAKMVVPVGE